MALRKSIANKNRAGRIGARNAQNPRWLPFVEKVRNYLRENAKEISLSLASYRLLEEEALRDAIDHRSQCKH
jgi:ribosomal protein L19E